VKWHQHPTFNEESGESDASLSKVRHSVVGYLVVQVSGKAEGEWERHGGDKPDGIVQPKEAILCALNWEKGATAKRRVLKLVEKTAFKDEKKKRSKERKGKERQGERTRFGREAIAARRKPGING